MCLLSIYEFWMYFMYFIFFYPIIEDLLLVILNRTHSQIYAVTQGSSWTNLLFTCCNGLLFAIFNKLRFCRSLCQCYLWGAQQLYIVVWMICPTHQLSYTPDIISSLAICYVFISVPVCFLFGFTLIQHEYNINLDLYRGIQFELYTVTMNIRSEILQWCICYVWTLLFTMK